MDPSSVRGRPRVVGVILTWGDDPVMWPRRCALVVLVTAPLMLMGHVTLTKIKVGFSKDFPSEVPFGKEGGTVLVAGGRMGAKIRAITLRWQGKI